jgi:hypothetical protein
MPKIAYKSIKLGKDSLAIVEQANEIIAEYDAQGYSLTLRQLYYQFVSRDILPNTQQSYKRLGSIVNDARLAGLIDWNAIEDRTRNLHKLPAWNDAADLISSNIDYFRLPKWDDQPYYVEVWIEKEALAGVFERICDELQVPFFACRGYTSQSEMWVAGQRLKRNARKGKEVVILHFGDHDPSGVDMTRDITDRLELFMGGLEVKRLALNMEQVEEHEPPPNPAKITDSRASNYISIYGDESWELDALEPDVLAGLVRDFVEEVRDDDLWAAAVEREDEHKRLLGEVSKHWDKITKKL